MNRRPGENAPLETLIRQRIAAEGPIRFDTFMELALYHPEHGYYSSGRVRTGWEGDFLTSPELDPAFGGLWARAVEEIWIRCERPTPFNLIEVGPGEGALASTLVAAASDELREALEIHLVERVGAARARQEQRLGGMGATWHGSLYEVPPREGVVILNEILDNLPVRIFESDGEHLWEILVTVENGLLVEVLAPVHAGRTHVPARERVETRSGVGELLRPAGRALSGGALVVVDYGYRQTDAHRYPAGTVVCYSSDGADALPLQDVGNKDITAHVDWTALETELVGAGFDPWGPETQRDLLVRLGAGAWDRTLRQEHDLAIAEGRGADALALISRRQALGALLDKGGLGGLEVMCGWKKIEPPAFAASP